jgi:hypothetical protein
MSSEWDRRAEHQGSIRLRAFWGSRLGCLTLLVIVAVAACVPWLIKLALLCSAGATAAHSSGR